MNTENERDSLGDYINERINALRPPEPALEVPVPGGYSMIASGDVVPWFDPKAPGRILQLWPDGSVTWREIKPEVRPRG